MDGGHASCDQSVAEPGDSCGPRSTKAACAADGARVLACANGVMAELYRCRGPAGCRSEGGKVSCDQTIARVGDSCDEQLQGHIACAEDMKALTLCNDGRFAASERCKPGTTCSVSGQSTSCRKP